MPMVMDVEQLLIDKNFLHASIEAKSKKKKINRRNSRAKDIKFDTLHGTKNKNFERKKKKVKWNKYIAIYRTLTLFNLRYFIIKKII